MTRVQVLLTEAQDQRLEALAKALRSSKARLVREGVDLVLRRKIPRGKDPLFELVGQAGTVGRSNISSAHDEYLFSLKPRRKRRR